MIKIASLCILFATTIYAAQTDEEKLQQEVYILAGVFGGVALLLFAMIFGLAFGISSLQKKVQKAKAQQSRRAPPAGGNVFNSDPEMNIRGAPGPPRTFSNEGAGPGPSYKQDDIPLEPIHHQRDGYSERDAYSSRGQGYGYRGEERNVVLFVAWTRSCSFIAECSWRSWSSSN